MNSKKYIYICFIIIISVIFTACSFILIEDSKILKTSRIIMESNKNHKYESIDFNLGQKYINDGDNEKGAYFLRGIMSIPIDIQNKKLKPVLIIHGCHDRNNLRRFDTGFKYLTEYLAQNGYLAISIDVNSAFDLDYGDYEEYTKIPIIADEHIQSLKKANKGEIYYGVDLKDKIDLDNMSIIGHSTGGEAIFDIVNKERKKGIKINNLLAIAPTINKDTNFNIDIDNVAILVPGLDGDVTDLCGLSIYNTLRKENKNLKLLCATTLKYANHNYFNSEVNYNDAEMEGVDLTNQISRYEQEKFLQEYTVNFLEVCFGKSKKNTIYDDKIGSVTTINNLNVLNYLSTDDRKELVDVSKLMNFKSNKVNVELAQDCSPIDKDTALGINLPGTNTFITDLLNITWESKGGKFSFKPVIMDLSKYDHISINVIVDGLNKLNKKNESQSFSIELVDNKGQSQIVDINKSSNLLLYPSGKKKSSQLSGNKPIVYWSDITPMNNIMVPLTYYDKIDLTKIRKINILFDESDTGALMFESFSVN